MASPVLYGTSSGGGSSSSSKSPLYGAGAQASVKKSKEKNGVVGFFEHLGEDVRDAAVGLPMGLVQTVEHPIRTVKQTAQVTWQTWSPLVHGDYGKFAHDFQQHPLAPILDIFAVASLGLGSAAKLGETGALGSRVARLATTPEIKVVGADGLTQTRVLSRRGGARLRQNLVHEAINRKGGDRAHPLFSNEALYKRLSEKEGQRWQFAVNGRMGKLAQAYKDVVNPVEQRKVFEHMYWQIRKGPAVP